MNERVMQIAGYNWQEYQDNLKDFLNEIADNIKSSMVSHNVNASGRTMRSIDVRTAYTRGIVKGVILADRHFPVIETGRERTRRKTGANLEQIIFNWTYDRGMNFADENKRRKFSRTVAYLIHKRGTKLYLKGGRKDIYSQIIAQYTNAIKTNPKVLNSGEMVQILKTMFRGNITTTKLKVQY